MILLQAMDPKSSWPEPPIQGRTKEQLLTDWVPSSKQKHRCTRRLPTRKVFTLIFKLINA